MTDSLHIVWLGYHYFGMINSLANCQQWLQIIYNKTWKWRLFNRNIPFIIYKRGIVVRWYYDHCRWHQLPCSSKYTWKCFMADRITKPHKAGIGQKSIHFLHVYDFTLLCVFVLSLPKQRMTVGLVCWNSYYWNIGLEREMRIVTILSQNSSQKHCGAVIRVFLYCVLRWQLKKISGQTTITVSYVYFIGYSPTLLYNADIQYREH